MKRLGLASFTDRGGRLAETLAAAFADEYEILRYENGLKDWCGGLFESGADGIIFVGACGIAVRAIAPFLKSKTTDPAVLVIDEAGQFVISLLSGHIGGANRLALRAASVIGAVPVITTATDVNRRFAVDVFAMDNGLKIGSMKAAKEISAAILRGDCVGLSCEGRIEGPVPPELTVIKEGQEIPRFLIFISPGSPQRVFPAIPSSATVLHLRPKCFMAGIGCRKGKTKGEIADLVSRALARAGISAEEIAGVASIDLKKDEPGLLDFCVENGLPFETYSAEVLCAVPGEFSASAFVRQTAGVDNVCERAALCMAGPGGKLILKKQAENGVTVALAMRDWSVHFEK